MIRLQGQDLLNTQYENAALNSDLGPAPQHFVELDSRAKNIYFKFWSLTLTET